MKSNKISDYAFKFAISRRFQAAVHTVSLKHDLKHFSK